MKKIKGILKKILPNFLQSSIKYILSIINKIKESKLIKKQSKLHQKALEKIRIKILNKVKIKIAFFVIHSSVWKYEEIYHMFYNDERIEPIVIICPVINYGHENMVNEMRKSYNLFKKQGYNVIKTYNEEKKKYLDVKNVIAPDIIFYSNPYKGLIHNKYYITKFTHTLTCYVQYAYPISDNNIVDQVDLLFHNIVWKRFQETEYHYNWTKEHSRNRGVNAILIGYPGTDKLIYGKRQENNKWKSDNRYLKRIIWAPHHTIESESNLSLSSFLFYYDFMLYITEKYNYSIQIAFKPHPLLKVKLYNHKDWGKEKTDSYYDKWMNIPNGQLDTDDYIDLFNSSDALIHDSGSFIAEYLFTGKPVLFTFVNNYVYNRFNKIGKDMLNNHYKAYTKEDIIHFIEEIVINGNDDMKINRDNYYNNYLIPPNNQTASKNLYDFIIKKISSNIEI